MRPLDSWPPGVRRDPAEPVRISLTRAKALPAAEGPAEGWWRLLPPQGQRLDSGALELPEGGQLPDLLDLGLYPTPLSAPAQPGQRLGHGDAVLSLPIRRWLQL
jgi:hypothetical protein